MNTEVPPIASSWDDLLAGITTREAWAARREQLRAQYLELIRDHAKPPRVAPEVRVEETHASRGGYRLQLISYRVDAQERAFAWLGVPEGLSGPAPGIIALHGTTAEGGLQTAGLGGNPTKDYLPRLCQRGFVVLAPEHFVSGRRTPPEGAYETARFYEAHPEWTAVGKFTFEHSVAVDILAARPEVDAARLGVMGHSLGGQGAFYLAAYDERLRAAVCNCGGASFRHNPRVEMLARDHWYVYFRHLREGLLRGEMPPIDLHQIIALIAPRAFLDISAWNDGHPPTQHQRILMLRKLSELYDLLETPERFSFFVHGKKHSVPPESHSLIYAFFEEQLKA